VEIDEAFAKAVAAALTRGQGAFSEDDFIAACQQVYGDKVAGTFAELMFEGQLGLVVDEDEVKYIGLGLADKVNANGEKFSEEEIAAAVEDFISSARSPDEQAD
jgi:hypothetical protein